MTFIGKLLAGAVPGLLEEGPAGKSQPGGASSDKLAAGLAAAISALDPDLRPLARSLRREQTL